MLEMRAHEPTKLIDFTIAANGFSRRNRQPETMFLPDNDVIRHGDAQLIGLSGDYNGVLFQYFLVPHRYIPMREEMEDVDNWPGWSDEERDAREAEITGLQVERTFSENFVLQTGEMHAPMEALRTCLDELMLHWGIDVAAHRSVQSKVKPRDMQVWARKVQEQYPREMLSKRMGARLRIRLGVSEEGHATSCHVQNRVSHESFEEQACEILLDEARFAPAIDANGNPIASYYLVTVFYFLGGLR